jgi:flavin-dependent dehydrogenase
VLVLDAQQFPRFQVGESLLPICLPVLVELGIEVRPDTFVFKRGATFVSEALDKHRSFNFENALPGPPRHAWQVRRDKFDSQIAEQALAAGAVVQHGVKVAKVEFTPDAVFLDCEPATASDVLTVPKRLEARYLLDASGQGRLLARQFDSVVPYEGFGRSAAVMHFEGIPDAFEQDIGPGNEIQVLILDESWGWVIPLPNRVLSVGLVTRKRCIAAAIEEHVANSKLLQRWTAGAHRTDPRPIRNFSYTNTRSYGSRFACVGDAACFLDPVFSSGVALGLVSARQVTHNLLPALAEKREADPSLMAKHFEDLQPGYQAFAGIRTTTSNKCWPKPTVAAPTPTVLRNTGSLRQKHEHTLATGRYRLRHVQRVGAHSRRRRGRALQRSFGAQRSAVRAAVQDRLGRRASRVARIAIRASRVVDEARAHVCRFGDATLGATAGSA